MSLENSTQSHAKNLFDIESPMAIELRRIMIRVGRQLDLDRKRSIMVTSAERGEGKSLFSLHFSLVLAFHLRRKILLVDADIRRPVQHTVFQTPLSPGFSELLMTIRALGNKTIVHMLLNKSYIKMVKPVVGDEVDI